MKLNEMYDKYQISKEIENELDLSDLDAEKNPLRTIYSKISEKLENYASILEDLIQPSDMTSMQEIQVFSEEDKKIVLKLFKTMMKTHRKGLQVNVMGENEEFAKFINDFWKEWPSLKKELRLIFEKMEKSWDGDNFIKVELGYLG